MVEQNCGTCAFFRRMTQEAGECRRHPPQVVVLQQSGTQPQFDPVTKAIVERQVIVQKPQGVFPALKVDDPGCGDYLLVMDEAGESFPPGGDVSAPSKIQTMHDP